MLRATAQVSTKQSDRKWSEGVGTASQTAVFQARKWAPGLGVGSRNSGEWDDSEPRLKAHGPLLGWQ